MVKAARECASTSSEVCCPRSGKLRARATKPYARLFKALGDPTRLEIVGLLSEEGGELCVCDIESHFDLSQPTVSHHLRILREAGIVGAERRGTWAYYSLNPVVRKQLADFQALIRP